MISQFFILSPRGDTIILRDYLGNIPKVKPICVLARNEKNDREKKYDLQQRFDP
jgi:hypothetical protein